MITIHIAEGDEEIGSCYHVMVQLRTHLSEEEFVTRVHRQWHEGYRLAFLTSDDRVRAVAGYRIAHCLAWGKFLYVDDLVTDEEARSSGFGALLFKWLVDKAREHSCDQLHLDSGVQRFDAHRFYLAQRMEIRSHHFSLRLHP